MADINSIMSQAAELRAAITRLLISSTYHRCGDLSEVSLNPHDSEQLFLRDELEQAMEKLADAADIIRHIGSPVDEISHLHRNSLGKYETAQGHVYRCGSPIEALVSDDRHDVPYWTRTRVEHDGEDYYLVGYRDVSLNGLVIRTRIPS